MRYCRCSLIVCRISSMSVVLIYLFLSKRIPSVCLPIFIEVFLRCLTRHAVRQAWKVGVPVREVPRVRPVMFVTKFIMPDLLIRCLSVPVAGQIIPARKMSVNLFHLAVTPYREVRSQMRSLALVLRSIDAWRVLICLPIFPILDDLSKNRSNLMDSTVWLLSMTGGLG
ncbi:unknown protein [Fragaria chiloensis latent virus]|uniref:Uncharacterized protein n=1 Tax=Fragaria chiloensis latent virus TaxID=255238 RepID=Q5MNU0_9BROM|nr:hypothetical protein [Fragaria chiloensis latent virus]AAV98386.1 unknown protein [Fragaria chiloensis latent virus]